MVLPELLIHLRWKPSCTSSPVSLAGDSNSLLYGYSFCPLLLAWKFGLLGEWKKVEPEKYLSCQHALLFQLGGSAFPMPFLDYGALVNPEDPRSTQFPWRFVWPWIIVPLPVQRLIIQPGAIFFFSNLIPPTVQSLWKERTDCPDVNFSWSNQTWSL